MYCKIFTRAFPGTPLSRYRFTLPAGSVLHFDEPGFLLPMRYCISKSSLRTVHRQHLKTPNKCSGSCVGSFRKDGYGCRVLMNLMNLVSCSIVQPELRWRMRPLSFLFTTRSQDLVAPSCLAKPSLVCGHTPISWRLDGHYCVRYELHHGQ